MDHPLEDAALTLAQLEAKWYGVLYAAPHSVVFNGHRVGQFGWKGITVSRDGDKELLRAIAGTRFLGSRKRPAPGSDEEKEVVRELALRIIAAHKAQEEPADDAEDEQADEDPEEEEEEEEEGEEEVEGQQAVCPRQAHPVPPLRAPAQMAVLMLATDFHSDLATLWPNYVVVSPPLVPPDHPSCHRTTPRATGSLVPPDPSSCHQTPHAT